MILFDHARRYVLFFQNAHTTAQQLHQQREGTNTAQDYGRIPRRHVNARCKRHDLKDKFYRAGFGPGDDLHSIAGCRFLRDNRVTGALR
ncbi:hypothetical protein D3C80_1741390 [compost metagenome]